VTITTAPITAYHFQQVTPGGVVGNLLLAPLLELVALPLALAGTALGEVGAPLVRIATWLVEQIDRGAELLALVTPVGHVAVASALVTAILVALGLVLASRARRTRLDLALWAAMCAAWACARTPPPDAALRITFLDVGQGDAALVELPDGAVWLVDAGGLSSARDLRAASAPGRAIERTLAAYGHHRIDLAIISHPHPDHYLGLAAITAPIHELWIAEEPDGDDASEPVRGISDGRSFRSLAEALVLRGTRLVHPPLGLARVQAGVELRVWAPRYRPTEDAYERCAADPVRGTNDNSLVLTLHYRGRTVLFTGDIEAEGEELLTAANVPRVDVVKVPHHGSPTSSSEALVAATRPTLAVISCGRGNSFGFPAAGVLARWRAAGAEVARTDIDGAITVIIDAAGNLAFERFVVE
jgi:competence protein ComEC